MDKEIDKLIDKSHLKEDDEVVAYVQKRRPGTDKKAILLRNKRKRQLRGQGRPKEIEKHYYYPVFSNHLHGFQVDLLLKSKDEKGAPKGAVIDKDDADSGARQRLREYPPFFFIAINTNTKWGYAYPMKAKTSAECLRCLQRLWNDTEGKLVSIVCDEEAGLDSNEVNAWAQDREQRISIKSIRDQNHTSLSVVDRFIRTLRDMNTPTEKTKRTSQNKKYRDFTAKRMQKLINIYNRTKNQATGQRPKDMERNEDLEKAHIIKKLYESERRHKLKDYHLQQDFYVKYIIPRDKMQKHRYKISPECYQIKGRDGHAYIIAAADGTTLTLTRWRLIPIGADLPKGMKLARSVNGGKGGLVKKILDYKEAGSDPVKEPASYHVLWKSPTGTHIDTWEPLIVIKRLRDDANKLTRHEEAYWRTKKMPDGILP
jgi:hypothetical protein